MGNELSPCRVLVFDWEGNPIKQYKIAREAGINQNGGWSIVFYNLREKAE